MKILIAGDWHSNLHEKPIFDSFKFLGYETFKFEWNLYFKVSANNTFIKNFILKFQNKYLLGPVINKMNLDFFNFCLINEIDYVFLYRGTHIYKNTISKLKIKQPKIKIIGYNNDDPFSANYPKWMWRHFINSLPQYDLVFAYRKKNIQDLLNAGAKKSHLLRSWFVPKYNYPLVLNSDDKLRYDCDIVFIGHYENDGRLECIEKIVEAGYKVKLYGHGFGWDKALLNSSLKHLVPVLNVWGENYNKALNGAKIGLCFLSKINKDTYTRRCFEIPASKLMLLSEYSEDLTNLFISDFEAVYFRNQDELLQKIKFYLSNPHKIDFIANNGYIKVYNGKHDVLSRAKEIIHFFNEV